MADLGLIILLMLSMLMRGSTGVLDERSELSECVLKIVNNAKTDARKVTVLASPNNGTLVTEIVTGATIPVQINAIEHPQSEGMEKRVRNDIVVIVDAVFEVQDILNDVLWNSNTKFIIISDSYQRIDEDFREFWNFMVVNVFALLKNAEDVTLYSFIPYGTGDCDAGEPIALDKCNKGVYQAAGLSQVKENIRIRDMNQCPMNVSVVNLKPVLFFPKGCHDNRSKTVDGIEARLFAAIADKMHFTPTYAAPRDGVGWGWIYPPPPRGVVGEIYLGVSDFGFGLLAPTTERYENLDLSVPYGEKECITFAVPAGSGQKPPSWVTNLLVELRPTGWLFLILSIVVMCTVFWFWSSSGAMWSFLYVFSSFLGHTVKMPRKKALKYLVLVWIVYSYGITGIYQASMGSQITVPVVYSDIKTFKELLLSGLKPIGFQNMLRLIELVKDDENLREIAQRFVVDDIELPDAVNTMVEKRQIAYIRHISSFLYSSLIDPKARGNVRPLKQCVYNYPPIFAMRKNSPFSQAVDRIILRLFEAGITKYWKSIFLYDVPDSGPNFTQFKIDQSIGIFAILLIGMATASAVFVVEVFYAYLKIKSVHKRRETTKRIKLGIICR